MKLELPQHRIFEDAKHIHIDVDLTLCWPSGAGGHFICNEIADNKYPTNLLNEFIHPDSLSNHLDQRQLYHVNPNEMIGYLDSVYDTLIGFDTSKHNRILRTHNYPLLLSKVFNFSSKEIVIIYPDEESRYLIRVLLIIKHRFNTTWNTNSISELIDRVLSVNFKVKGDDIVILSQLVNDYCKSNVDLSHTFIIWDYLLYCKQHNLVSTKDIFNNFIKDIFNYDSDLNVSLDQLSEIKNYLSNFGNCTVINYTDLFFKLKIPNTGYLSKLKKDNIYNYSKTNLDLITRYSSLVDDAEAERIKNYVNIMERYLTTNVVTEQHNMFYYATGKNTSV